ncbi:MAG: sigma-54-dependent Fis family transcriptional regulator [Deltaproteobacteria bacterium]|nr:sigma-54-dependent Fis family transcriptional regulator [Deltaproteobacteria bacterium]
MGTSIVVVEPDGYTADHLTKTFRGGYHVHHERTGREGLERLKAVRPDVAFVDLYLPDMDGRRLLEDVRTSGMETSVLMVSGKKNLGAVVSCMKLGALDFLEKPFRPDDFYLALRRVEERIRLEREVRRLRSEVEKGSPYHLLFGANAGLRDVQAVVDQVADTDITVLLRGESGTGKDLLAKAIWQCSSRRGRPLVKVNCAALPRELLESELFGYEQGAFTGASHTKQGKFEYADGGTIFLDEITEMHLDLQAKLLHVLQDGEVCRLGGKTPIRVDVRVIAATNRNLADEIQQRRFREDLFYRLNVVNLVLPPLRERAAEIPAIVDYFLDRFSQQYDRPAVPVPSELLAEMSGYRWPGNVRELENYAKRLVVLGDVDGVRREIQTLRAKDRSAEPAAESLLEPEEFDGKTLKEVAKLAASRAERIVLEQVLAKTRWNRKKAASHLDISYKALLYKIRETGLE